MNIRLVELPISGSPDECLERCSEAAAIEPLPDLSVFPELFSVGYDLDRMAGLSGSMEQLESHLLGKLALEKEFWLAPGTFPVLTPEGIFNRFPLFSREGKLVWYTDKVHLFRNMGEDEVFIYGRSGGTFDIDGMKAGGIVCYDLRFPELSRALVLNGAELILVPAEWPEVRLELFRSLLRARAAEAQVFVAGCNLGGEHLGVRFGGGGGIAHPSGQLLGWRDVTDGVRDFEINPDDVGVLRGKIDCLADRRPGSYDTCPCGER